MLALAVLPMVSHALALARGGPGAWVEVCTPQGMRLVAVDDSAAQPAAPVSAEGHLEHCPSCLLGADASGPPPAALAAWSSPQGPAGVPLLFLQAPRTLFAWRSAQPRGPPAFS
jgi:hypothetical protein